MSLLAAVVQKTWQSSRICRILRRTFDFPFTDVSRDSFPGTRVQNCDSLVHHCSQLWHEYIRWGTCSVSNTNAKLPTSQGMLSVVNYQSMTEGQTDSQVAASWTCEDTCIECPNGKKLPLTWVQWSRPKWSQVNASARKAWPNGVTRRPKFSTYYYLQVRLTRA